MEVIKEDTNRKAFHVHGLEDLMDIVKIVTLPKMIRKFNTVPITIPMAFFFFLQK